MNKCEYCNTIIDGLYGSGRFCNRKCACGFSSLEKRDEINAVVSAKLKGRKPAHPFRKGYDPNRRKFGPPDWEKAVIANKNRLEKLYESLSWDDLPLPQKRRIILKEQDGKCCSCGIDKWLDERIVFELHHEDGNKKNNARNNLKLICPNCHSQTPNWKSKNRKTNKC